MFGGKATLPRDNPVKDFLISADEKFRNFKREGNFYSVLFIIWDDFIYEPISAFLAKPAGLFLEDSFARDGAGKALRFKNVDAVFLDRQLTQFMNSAGDPFLGAEYNPQDFVFWLRR